MSEIFSLIFCNNKKDKFKNETYKIDKVKLNAYQEYLDKDILDKININETYSVNDIYRILEIKQKEVFKDIIEYLMYRDIFGKNKGYILLLKDILDKKGDLKNYIVSEKRSKNLGLMPMLNMKKLYSAEKNGNLVIMSESSSEESSSEEINFSEEDVKYLGFCDIFKQLGIISKDQRTNFINPSFYNLLGIVPEKKEVKKRSGKITSIEDIPFDDFFPGKSNGRVIRYLKIYKLIPNKPKDYTKEVFRAELLDLSYVEQKPDGKYIYYKSGYLDGLKAWIADKLIQKD